MGRSPCCHKEGLNKGPWTADEDKLLTDYIKGRGEGKWGKVPKETGNSLSTNVSGIASEIVEKGYFKKKKCSVSFLFSMYSCSYLCICRN
jgi:hypothetical protein